MKALLIATLVILSSTFTAVAGGNNTKILVKERANHLSDQMIRDLRLNNYQANEIREINTLIVAKLTEAEKEFNGNPEMLNQKVKSILNERDVQLEDVLSIVQYNNYFGKRPTFNKIDKEFVASIQNSGNEIAGNVSTID
jgi:hypothetical protein